MPADQSKVVTRSHPIPSDPFEESVYDLIPQVIIPPAKAERYRSKFANQARAEYFSDRKQTASMGPAKVYVNPPQDFLKKGKIEKVSNTKSHFSPDRAVRKQPVPKDSGVIPDKTKKDFVKLNALENINAVPKKPSNGPTSYLTKKDYGRAPDYLVKKIQKAEEEKKMAQAEAEAAQEAAKQFKNGLVLLPESERVKILDGLTANWNKLNGDYQKLSLTVDTIPKIARKVNMENQLKHLEEHIQKFSHTNIYVDFKSVYGS